jgi:hypothetical protein
MAIRIYCNLCRQELEELSALCFSPPTKGGNVIKFHICSSCWKRVLMLFDRINNIEGAPQMREPSCNQCVNENACSENRFQRCPVWGVAHNGPILFKQKETEPSEGEKKYFPEVAFNHVSQYLSKGERITLRQEIGKAIRLCEAKAVMGFAKEILKKSDIYSRWNYDKKRRKSSGMGCLGKRGMITRPLTDA